MSKIFAIDPGKFNSDTHGLQNPRTLVSQIEIELPPSGQFS
jgi:hypothetical protein